MAIFKEVESLVLTLISLLEPSLFFWGSSSIIFCSRVIYFYMFIFLVFSFKFSFERLLIWSTLFFRYFWAWCYLADGLLYQDSYYYFELLILVKYYEEAIVFYMFLEFTFIYWVRVEECFFWYVYSKFIDWNTKLGY